MTQRRDQKHHLTSIALTPEAYAQVIQLRQHNYKFNLSLLLRDAIAKAHKEAFNDTAISNPT